MVAIKNKLALFITHGIHITLLQLIYQNCCEICVCVRTVVICINIILWTDSTLCGMASADVLPRLQQRAVEADQIITQLKAQLQQLKYSTAASSKLFLKI